MRIELPYGSDPVTAEMAWGRHLATLDIADTPALPDVTAAVMEAMAKPIGMQGALLRSVQPGQRVAIIVSDQFRRTGVEQYLPVLLEGLNRAGVPDDKIQFIFATGSHRPPTQEEQQRIVSESVFNRFAGRLFNHDPADRANLRRLGATTRGTPVFINRRALDCDHIIATGAVVLHYFGGYGGGRKAIVPGIAGLETISHNHALNLDPREDRLNPNVRIGVTTGNPVAEDMLEAARFAKVTAIINTVMNRHGQIAGVFAGDLEQAHRAACDFARELFAVSISEQADLVIASSGATLTYVQSHKALFNSYQAVKPNGRIVFLSRCPEGLGGEQFVKWMRLGSREAIIAGLRKQSEINGQTALSTLQKTPKTLMVSDMPHADVTVLGARKLPDLVSALDLARRELAEAGLDEPSYYVMPSAAYTVPFLQGLVGGRP